MCTYYLLILLTTYLYRVYYDSRRRDFSLAVYGKPGRMLLLLHVALSAFIDPRSPEPLASELRELSSGASPDAPEHAPLTPQLELNDAPIMELHSTRVQGSTCKHAAIPTGLSRRCDWVVLNETSAGLIKHRSPPRCVSSPIFPRNLCNVMRPPHTNVPGLSSYPCAWAKLR